MAPVPNDPSLGLIVISRVLAIFAILGYVLAFTMILLDKGFSLQDALLGAGAGGVVAGQIAHRLLGEFPTPAAPPNPEPSTKSIDKTDDVPELPAPIDPQSPKPSAKSIDDTDN